MKKEMKSYSMVAITADDGAREILHCTDQKIGARRRLTRKGWMIRLEKYFGRAVKKYEIVFMNSGKKQGGKV